MRKDAVTPAVREAVLRRDRICFMARLTDDHQCRDRWGNPHPADDTSKLTLDHVHDGYGLMGRRAPSDPAHLLAMYFQANVQGPSRLVRAAERAYLAQVEGETK